MGRHERKARRSSGDAQRPAQPAGKHEDSTVVATCQASRFSKDSAQIILQDLCIEVPGRSLLDGASLNLQQGRRYGLIGQNGTGKTTLLQQLAVPGRLVPSHVSSLLVQQDEVGDDRTPLQTVLAGDSALATVLAKISLLKDALKASADDNSAAAAAALRALSAWDLRQEALTITEELASASGPRAKQLRQQLQDAEAAAAAAEEAAATEGSSSAAREAVEEQLEELEAAPLPSGEMIPEAVERALELLHDVGFDGDPYKPNDPAMPTRLLSGGWQMRVSLARALFCDPRLLMLDEPSNHLDLQGLAWLEEWLAESLPPSTVLIVSSHDVDFLDRVATDMLRIAAGKLETYPGNYSAYAKVAESAGAAAAREGAALDRKKTAMERSMADMLSKVSDKKMNEKRCPKAGQKGNRHGNMDPHDDKRQTVVKTRQKKLEERWGTESNEKGGRFKLSRDMAGSHESARPAVRGHVVDPEVRLELVAAAPPGHGGPLLRLEDVSLGWGGKGSTPVLSKLSFSLDSGERLGVVGDNGCGKSTLLSALNGILEPLEGFVSGLAGRRVAYYSQVHQDEFLRIAGNESSQDFSVVDLLTAKFNSTALEGRTHAAKFGLKGRLALQPVSQLSGGQKCRATLALMFWTPPHVLLMDEPTNHLDMQTVAALTEALTGFEGSIVVASHHRRFLCEVCTKVIVLRNGCVDETLAGGDAIANFLAVAPFES